MSTIEKYIKVIDSNEFHYRGNIIKKNNQFNYFNFEYKYECFNKHKTKDGYMYVGPLDSALIYGDKITIFVNIEKINLLNLSLSNTKNIKIYLNKLSKINKFLAFLMEFIYGMYDNIYNINTYDLTIDEIADITIAFFEQYNEEKYRKINDIKLSGVLILLLLFYGLGYIFKNKENYEISVNKVFNKIPIIFKINFDFEKKKIIFYKNNKYHKIFFFNEQMFEPKRLSYFYLDIMFIMMFNKKYKKIKISNNKYLINGIFADDEFTSSGMCYFTMEILLLLNIENQGDTCIVSDYILFNNFDIIPKYLLILNNESNDQKYYLQRINNKCSSIDNFSFVKLDDYVSFKSLKELKNFVKKLKI
jgi:hypothetical protein